MTAAICLLVKEEEARTHDKLVPGRRRSVESVHSSAWHTGQWQRHDAGYSFLTAEENCASRAERKQKFPGRTKQAQVRRGPDLLQSFFLMRRCAMKKPGTLLKRWLEAKTRFFVNPGSTDPLTAIVEQFGIP